MRFERSHGAFMGLMCQMLQTALINRRITKDMKANHCNLYKHTSRNTYSSMLGVHSSIILCHRIYYIKHVLKSHLCLALQVEQQYRYLWYIFSTAYIIGKLMSQTIIFSFFRRCRTNQQCSCGFIKAAGSSSPRCPTAILGSQELRDLHKEI